MIGRLRGTLVRLDGESVVIDVGGVGYEVAVPVRTMVDLPGVGEDAVMHTHLHVREDQLALFGFASTDDRDLFRLLLGISGSGPKVAIAILSVFYLKRGRQHKKRYPRNYNEKNKFRHNYGCIISKLHRQRYYSITYAYYNPAASSVSL